MKILRSVIFAVALILGGFAAPVRPQAKPISVVEYNVGACGGQTFTVQHAIISNGKLAFTHFMPGPGEVQKDPDSLTFEYKESPADKDGNVNFTAKTDYEKSKLELRGMINKGRLVGVLLVDGELGHVYYGTVGNVDDMIKVAKEDFQICLDIHHVDQNEIPKILKNYLTASDNQTQ